MKIVILFEENLWSATKRKFHMRNIILKDFIVIEVKFTYFGKKLEF